MRKIRSRKQTNKKRAHRSRCTRRCRRVKRGGAIITPMIGSLEGEEHKGLNKIVVAGPMGVMSGSAYVKMMVNQDQQGPE